MAPIKKRPYMRSNHKPKQRRRKPKISELVYKFLMPDDDKEDERAASRTTETQKCRFCKLRKRHEVLDSMNSRITGSTAKKRKDASKNARIHRVKRHRTSRDQTLSACIEKCSRGEG
ncbi:hypothetical protein ANTQUA_LOCUS7896 [Anthophora quadrimaculata]